MEQERTEKGWQGREGKGGELLGGGRRRRSRERRDAKRGRRGEAEKGERQSEGGEGRGRRGRADVGPRQTAGMRGSNPGDAVSYGFAPISSRFLLINFLRRLIVAFVCVRFLFAFVFAIICQCVCVDERVCGCAFACV